MIEIKNLTKAYGGKTVLDSLSLSIPEGVFTVISGRSGCGKTTLLRIIAGLEEPDGGTVEYNRELKKSMVFQENRLFPHATALENIVACGADEADAVKMLSGCLLGSDIHTRVGRMSGGMKRRVAIARALAVKADIYFMDEPLRELDRETADTVRTLIKTVTAGKTVIAVSHSQTDADFLADNLIVLG